MKFRLHKLINGKLSKRYYCEVEADSELKAWEEVDDNIILNCSESTKWKLVKIVKDLTRISYGR